jgi:hypothetical protein
MKMTDRRELNEGWVDHIERLGRVRASIVDARPGAQATGDYEVAEITKAIMRLASEIKTDVVTPDEIPV